MMKNITSGIKQGMGKFRAANGGMPPPPRPPQGMPTRSPITANKARGTSASHIKSFLRGGM